jgi:hypothetical protein
MTQKINKALLKEDSVSNNNLGTHPDSTIKVFIGRYLTFKEYQGFSWLILGFKVLCFYLIFLYKDLFVCYTNISPIPVYSGEFNYVLFYFYIHIIFYFILIRGV